jgi:hypothetical protein
MIKMSCRAVFLSRWVFYFLPGLSVIAGAGENTSNGLQQYKMFHPLSGSIRKKQQDF